MHYQLSDIETVRRCWIKDFDWYTPRWYLDVYRESDDKKKAHAMSVALSKCEELIRAYDKKEDLFRTFELDSEYYPIVIIRSLLPQLLQSLKANDYETSFMISGWISQNGFEWRKLLHDFEGSRGFTFKGMSTID